GGRGGGVAGAMEQWESRRAREPTESDKAPDVRASGLQITPRPSHERCLITNLQWGRRNSSDRFTKSDTAGEFIRRAASCVEFPAEQFLSSLAVEDSLQVFQEQLRVTPAAAANCTGIPAYSPISHRNGDPDVPARSTTNPDPRRNRPRGPCGFSPGQHLSQ